MPVSLLGGGRVWLLIGAVIAALLLALPTADHGSDAGDGNPDAVGHSADGYYFDLMVGHRKIELPRLFLTRGANDQLRFDAFGSTHGAVESGQYTLADAAGQPLAEAELLSIAAEHKQVYYPVIPRDGGAVVIDFSISRQILFVFISALVLLIIAFRLASRYRMGIGARQAPKGAWQNMLEVLILFIRDEVARPAIGPTYKKYVPYLTTAFFFILLGNLLGLVPWGVTATSNIMVTATLAFFTFMITQFSGSKDYWRHIFWPPNVPIGIKFILIPIEVIGIFTKPVALAFRLFGNMISGHIAIVSLLGLIFIFSAKIGPVVGGLFVLFSVPLTIFIYLLKILVSFIQAYIFTMLSSVFIGMALEEHHHDDHTHHAPDGTVHAAH
ncbi:MAG: F0F1 ATP synthase subunit A [Rhodothermales bacterium]|nr:F0F1 ATP synthase subunit A [Rhodothermales bacterium]